MLIKIWLSERYIIFLVSIHHVILIHKDYESTEKWVTCDFSIVALCLSHIGLMSKFCSRSLSPCWKNSSIKRSTHRLYSSNGLVGLLKSAQCTKFCKTYFAKRSLFYCLYFYILFMTVDLLCHYLYSIGVVVQ